MGFALLAALALSLSAAQAATAAPPAGDPTKGQDVFEDRCGSCHVLGGVGQGPNLVGVVGRKAGTVRGYAYSAAIKRNGQVWTPARLDQFLTGPARLIPGTAMTAVVPSPVQRRDLIAYLASLKR